MSRSRQGKSPRGPAAERPADGAAREAPGTLAGLLESAPVAALRAASEGVACHLVGGVLRDRWLGLPARDLDAVLERQGERVALRLAELLGARLVRLGGERFAAFRLVAGDAVVDLWDREGASLRSDLARRDFTVNSLALDARSGRLVDPFGGLQDLGRRLLRATSAGAFAEDPLRTLRLVRFAVRLPRFRVDPESLARARAAASELAGVARERVREELRAIFARPAGAPALRLLVELDLYPGLLTGAPGRRGEAGRAGEELDLLGPRAEEVKRLVGAPGPDLDLHAAALAILLSNLPEAPERVRGCRRSGLISGREAERISLLLAWPRLPQSRERRRWFLHRCGPLWTTALAYLGCRPEAAARPQAWRAAAAELAGLAATAGAEIFEPRPLLDGREVERLLGVPPGPRLGELLELARRAQIEGRIGSRAEALELLRGAAGREPERG